MKSLRWAGLVFPVTLLVGAPAQAGAATPQTGCRIVPSFVPVRLQRANPGYRADELLVAQQEEYAI